MTNPLDDVAATNIDSVAAWMEKYRCRVCGGFDYDEDGKSIPCNGPEMSEPPDINEW